MAEHEPVGKWTAPDKPVRQRGMIHMLWHLRGEDGKTYTKRLDVRLPEVGSAQGEIPVDMNPADVVERIEVVNRKPDEGCDAHLVRAESVVRDASGLRGTCQRCRVLIELDAVPGGQTRVDAEGLRAALLTGRTSGRDGIREVNRLVHAVQAERQALEEAAAIVDDARRLALALSK